MSPASRLCGVSLQPHGADARWLRPGHIIGRSPMAGLRLDDPCVSEAHALLSLRGGSLVLLALRGHMVVDGRVEDRIELARGQEIFFTRGLGLQVVDLVLPRQVLCIQGPGLAPTVLPGACALVLEPQPHLAHATVDHAAVRLWPSANAWRLAQEGEVRDIQAGEGFVVGGQRYHLAWTQLGGAEPTQRAGALEAGLEIVCRYDAVHIFGPAGEALVINGVAAQLISELASFEVPVSWSMLAEAVWGRRVDAVRLRKRLDGALTRLRATLREAGLRSDLVRPMGNGMIELFLHPADRVQESN